MAIQFKRGSGHSSTTVLAAGQPYYDYTNNLLYIGASNGTTTIANTTAIKASMISPSMVTSFVSGGIYLISVTLNHNTFDSEGEIENTYIIYSSTILRYSGVNSASAVASAWNATESLPYIGEWMVVATSSSALSFYSRYSWGRWYSGLTLLYGSNSTQPTYSYNIYRLA